LREARHCRPRARATGLLNGSTSTALGAARGCHLLTTTSLTHDCSPCRSPLLLVLLSPRLLPLLAVDVILHGAAMARSKRPAMPAYPHEIAAQRCRVEEAAAAAATNLSIEPGQEARYNKDEMRAAAPSAPGTRSLSNSKSSGHLLTPPAGRRGVTLRGGHDLASSPARRRGVSPAVGVSAGVGDGRSSSVPIHGAQQPPPLRCASQPLVFYDVRGPSLMGGAAPASPVTKAVALSPARGAVASSHVVGSTPPPSVSSVAPPPLEAGCMLPPRHERSHAATDGAFHAGAANGSRCHVGAAKQLFHAPNSHWERLQASFWHGFVRPRG